MDGLQKLYDNTLEKAFRHPRLIVGSGAVLVIASFLIFVTIDQQLFPEMERNQFAVEVYLPTAYRLSQQQKLSTALKVCF